MKKIFIVNVPRTASDKQVYMQSFCEAWMAEGGAHVEGSKWRQYRLARHLMKMLALTGYARRKADRAYVVCSRGAHLLKSSLPYTFSGEIIPMLWDAWPDTWDTLVRDLQLLKCKTCFVTASDVAHALSQRLPNVRFVHIPEGVDTNDYQAGPELTARHLDVFEMGRKHFYYHKKLMDGKLEDRHSFVYNAHPKAHKATFVYDQWNTYTDQIADTRILISFPACMTNPKAKGNVDTLTIRYWEAMLSRCIMVGHCPQELIDIVGYNPVVEADFVDPCGQLEQILTHLPDYQALVDRNRQAALTHAPWRVRMKTVFDALEDEGASSFILTGFR